MLFAARGLGALVGPLLLRRVLARRPGCCPAWRSRWPRTGWLPRGGARRWFWLVLLLVLVAHPAGGGNWAMSNFALQLEVPDELRGRVFATDLMITTLAISVSQLVVGVLVDHVRPGVLVAAAARPRCCTRSAGGWRRVRMLPDLDSEVRQR